MKSHPASVSAVVHERAADVCGRVRGPRARAEDYSFVKYKSVLLKKSVRLSAQGNGWERGKKKNFVAQHASNSSNMVYLSMVMGKMGTLLAACWI